MNGMASGGGANGGGASFGAAGAIGGALAGMAYSGGQAMQNMLTYNAFGAQMQNQFGINAQYAQNRAYGNGPQLGVVL